MQVREMHELNARDLWHNIKYMFENEKKIIFFCCLVVAAARSFMICYECGKRRVIYCKTKLGRPELKCYRKGAGAAGIFLWFTAFSSRTIYRQTCLQRRTKLQDTN